MTLTILNPTQIQLNIKLARLNSELKEHSFFLETYNLALKQLILDQEGFMHSLVADFNTNKELPQEWEAFVNYCQALLGKLGLSWEESTYLINRYTEE
ncbi:MAG: hypothetical protein ACFFDT_00210 [Candidatus Hodarchaeota archaeon]